MNRKNTERLETFKEFEEVLYRVNDRIFNEIALSLFHFQSSRNQVYSEYLHHLQFDVRSIDHYEQIPFLPISFFKHHVIKTGNWVEEAVFTSSGTTGLLTSSHFVNSLAFYHQHATRCFASFLGSPGQYHLLALLPSYTERKGSSLISMVEHLVNTAGSPESGFFLNDTQKLMERLRSLKSSSRKTILWGVAFALMDLAEKYDEDLRHCIVIETGGMKGRRREVSRAELHDTIRRNLNVSAVFSEFGMTELFSQAYSTADGYFRCPPWMKVVFRNPADPLDFQERHDSGTMSIIDLANFATCAFVETEDIGRKAKNGSFEVLGRLDHADLRGCNLLVE